MNEALKQHQQCHDTSFAEDARAGLSAPQKWLSPKYFYDTTGSHLFEQITTLPEYYPTRCEMDILHTRRHQIAEVVPAGGALIEFGSGSSAKIRALLASLPDLAAYVPVDISADFLAQQTAELATEYPDVLMLPVAADFTTPFDLPTAVSHMPHIGFFPGSTIGNFEPDHARSFLTHAARMLGPGAKLLIGVDLVKGTDVLHAAYNDTAGVTAAFNRNVLQRMNTELNANFDLEAFAHRAFFDEQKSRIEMHLVSTRPQTVTVAGIDVDFATGETIHTENSYKYSVESFTDIAAQAGWVSDDVWMDPQEYFSVHTLTMSRDVIAV